MSTTSPGTDVPAAGRRPDGARPARPSSRASRSARSSGPPARCGCPPAEQPAVPEAERPAEQARFVAAADAVADRLAARAAAATGVSAEVLADDGRHGPRPRPASVRSSSGSTPARRAAVADGAGRAAVRRPVHRAGRPDGRAGHRRARRPGPDRRRADRPGGAGRAQPPDVPSVLLADDLAPADTAGLDPARVIGLATRLGGTTSHTAIIARQLGLPCVVAVGGLDDVPAGATVLLDGDAGHRHRGAGPRARRAGRVAAARAAAAALAGYTGPGDDPRRHAVQVLANVQDGAGARARPPRRTPRASACSAPSWPSSAAREEPTVEEQAAGYAEVLRRLRRAARSCSAPWTPARTSRWPSPRCPTRRTRRSACAGCGSPGATPGCSSASSTPSPRPRAAPAPTPVGDGADGGHRRRGGRLRGAGCAPAGWCRA